MKDLKNSSSIATTNPKDLKKIERKKFNRLPTYYLFIYEKSIDNLTIRLSLLTTIQP